MKRTLVSVLLVAGVLGLVLGQSDTHDADAPPAVPAGGGQAPPGCFVGGFPTLAIPDNDPAGVFDEAGIFDSFGPPIYIKSMQVYIRAEHTRVGDLSFTLTHAWPPLSVTLIDRPGYPAMPDGCEGDDIDVLLDDDAGSPVEDECENAVPTIQGVFAPDEPLRAFTGQGRFGTWTMHVADHAPGETGSLIEWCVIIDQVVVPAQGPLGVVALASLLLAVSTYTLLQWRRRPGV